MHGRARPLDETRELDRFLAGIERRAFRLARIATRDDDDALDVVQDAMLTLVRRYSTRGEREWAALFHCILQSRIRDWYRRTRVRTRLRQWFGGAGEENEEVDPVGTAPDPSTVPLDEELAQKRASLALQDALQRLPLRQQQAFLLRAWEELDVAETARAMGCSIGTVKTHYFRAIQTLRRQLGDHRP